MNDSDKDTLIVNDDAASSRSMLYARLKQDIIFGRLAPGAKLKLDDLKNTYAASISTLREALNRLASDGFVSARRQRGFIVAPVSRSDLTEIANLRILLECTALEASLQSGDTEWEAELVGTYHKLRLTEERMMSGDTEVKEVWKRFDWEFHKTMIQCCRNRNLLALHSTIFEKYLRYQMLVLTFRGRAAADEHKAMLDAALDRNIQKTQEILTAHVLGGFENSISAFTS